MSSGPSALLWKAGQYIVGVFLVLWLLGAVVELLMPLVPWIVAGVLVGLGLRAWSWHRGRW